MLAKILKNGRRAVLLLLSCLTLSAQAAAADPLEQAIQKQARMMAPIATSPTMRSTQ